MDEKEFTVAADAELAGIEAALERASDSGPAEFDFETKPGGIIEIEFDNGSKIIVNRHGVAREIWVAARAGGFHFRWDGAHWLDTRDGAELMGKLSALASGQAGETVILG